ncbi:MAG: hypothetical protein MPJ08_04385 [Nitrosopumilus sp.]|nr:hypothetical protein [Nitrosopumilus sp.]
MMIAVGVAALVALLAVAAVPALAEVKTLGLAAEFYEDEDRFRFEGTANPEDDDIVIQIAKERGGNLKGILMALTGADGEFQTQNSPKTVERTFRGDGIYNVTVTSTAGTIKQHKATLLQLKYEDGRITEYVPPVPKILLVLGDKTVHPGAPAIVPIRLGEGSVTGPEYTISDKPAGAEAYITYDKSGHKFLWTPEKKFASYQDVPYKFTIQAKKGSLVETGTITVTVKKAYDAPAPAPAPASAPAPVAAPEPTKIAFKVEGDPQSYIHRYESEPAYKAWFDKNYPQYDSIYEAVGVDAPKELAPFVEPGADPQSYVDRYEGEPAYKAWFDRTYPEYDSIYEAVGLEAPKPIAPFVDPDADPKTYVARYESEPAYRDWFDKTFPQYASIYEAVGIQEASAEEEPAAEEEERPHGACGDGTVLVNGDCTVLTEAQYGFCGEGTVLVDQTCEAASEKPWWQFW